MGQARVQTCGVQLSEARGAAEGTKNHEGSTRSRAEDMYCISAGRMDCPLHQMAVAEMSVDASLFTICHRQSLVFAHCSTQLPQGLLHKSSRRCRHPASFCRRAATARSAVPSQPGDCSRGTHAQAPELVADVLQRIHDTGTLILELHPGCLQSGRRTAPDSDGALQTGVRRCARSSRRAWMLCWRG